MILKRPYAFLIKYFKVINFILALLFIYIAYKSYNIMIFFNNYVANNYSGNFYSNFYMEYISPIVFLAFFIVIVLIVIILWLLIFKKKPIKMYAASIIYYLVILIFFHIVKNVMITMETSVITAEVSRIYRDMSLIFLIPQMFFIIQFIIRGLGLNIDKFHFEKDIKELEVSSEDNEEVELTFKNDAVKFKRGIRRYFREFVYYVKENKLIVSIVSGILGILLIVLIISLFPKKVDSNYKQGNSFNYKNVTYTIKDSIITNINYRGDIISNNKYYVVVLLNIKNDSTDDASLDYNNLRLEINKSTIYPIFDKGLNFIDYAKEYTGTLIKAKSDFDYSLVFEIEEKDIKSNYNIKFASGTTYVDNMHIGKYNYISITPSIINKVNLISTNKLAEEVTFLNSNVGNTKLKVNNPEILNKYVYDYEKCYNEKCNTYKGIISLDYTKNDKTLLVLGYEYTLDEKVAFAKTSKTVNGFMNYFAKIKYIIDDKEYYSNVVDRTPSNLKDKIVLEVSNKIENASKIYLSITIRNKEYLITLK